MSNPRGRGRNVRELRRAGLPTGQLQQSRRDPRRRGVVTGGELHRRSGLRTSSTSRGSPVARPTQAAVKLTGTPRPQRVHGLAGGGRLSVSCRMAVRQRWIRTSWSPTRMSFPLTGINASFNCAGVTPGTCKSGKLQLREPTPPNACVIGGSLGGGTELRAQRGLQPHQRVASSEERQSGRDPRAASVRRCRSPAHDSIATTRGFRPRREPPPPMNPGYGQHRLRSPAPSR